MKIPDALFDWAATHRLACAITTLPSFCLIGDASKFTPFRLTLDLSPLCWGFSVSRSFWRTYVQMGVFNLSWCRE